SFHVTGVQTCALPIYVWNLHDSHSAALSWCSAVATPLILISGSAGSRSVFQGWANSASITVPSAITTSTSSASARHSRLAQMSLDRKSVVEGEGGASG